MVSDATSSKRKRRSDLQCRAKQMRREPTEAEARFWHYAKNRGIDGLKFQRQVAVGPYIADFLCTDHSLIVEIDGGQHGEERDAARDVWLRSQGFRVLTAVSGGFESGFPYAPVSAKVASDSTSGGTCHGECLLDRLA